MSLQGIVAVILALQFAAFGWRINREIAVGDQARKTWLPLPDYINVVSMLGVAFFGIITPLANNQFGRSSKIAVAVACALIAFHPISMAAHYRLYSKEGRGYYVRMGKDYPWMTGQEAISIVISIVLAIMAGWYVGNV